MMDELLQKFFDGELTASEATELNQALVRNPEFDAELKVLERALGVLASTPALPGPTLSFSDNVMRRVATRAAPTRSVWQRRHPRRMPTWSLRLAWSAGCLLAFVLGYSIGDVVTRRDAAPPAQTATEAESTAQEALLRVARLVYVPSDAGVQQVSVAGTFNGWNPELTRMDRVGNTWVLVITLPPASYEYMFVENGKRWVTDPLAVQTRDDGFGRKNAVLDLTM